MQFLLRRAHLVSNWCARSHLAASQRKLQPRSFANSFRRTSCSSQGFEEWIARNPPPDSSKPHSWVVETVAASVPCAAGPLVQKLQGALQSGVAGVMSPVDTLRSFLRGPERPNEESEELRRRIAELEARLTQEASTPKRYARKSAAKKSRK